MKAEQSRAPYYVKLHLGDYARDADHLSMLQEGAYFRLMRWYYGTAKPIPNDLERIYRRCMAFSIEEQQAVRYILEEFFRLDGPQWRHKRIDQELQAWIETSDKAREAISARWQKKINKNNENADTNVVRPLYQPEPEPEPITRTKKTRPKLGARAPFVLPDWIPKDQWDAWIEARTKARKGPTDWAKHLAVLRLDELRSLGHHPAAVLAESAFNGWAGLFPLKERINAR